MPKGPTVNNLILQITATLASGGGILDILAVIDSFVPKPFDKTVTISRESVEHFLLQLTTRLPNELHEDILVLAETNLGPTTPPVVKVTELTPSSSDPHNITRFLADGGIGRVWIAHDEHLGREVVLKQLLPKTAANSDTSDRFVHEAQITGQLQHPNIVPVYSMDRDDDDAPFYTMRYIRGESFTDRIQILHQQDHVAVRSQEFYQLVEDFVCICNAVSYAHSQGIAHCDLKPENIAVGQFGEVTVLDWGLAHRFEKSRSSTEPHEESISGTPNYLSPEQAQGVREGLTSATDIYSLGAILFEMLFNRPPRAIGQHPNSLQTLLNSVIKGNIPHAVKIAPRNSRLIASICDKCLATLPGDRYSSVSHLIDDLYRWRNDERVHAAPDGIGRQISRRVRRHRRTTLTIIFLLSIATTLSVGFYSSINSSRFLLQQAANNEIRQQTIIDQQQIALTSAITNAVGARLLAEQGEREAQSQTVAAANATIEHQIARRLAEDATKQATEQQRIARIATAAAISQFKLTSMNRVSLDMSRARTEQLSFQRQLYIEDGYTSAAMRFADSGDFQRALASASQSRDHAQTIGRDPTILAEHHTRIMALRSHLPVLVGYRQFSNAACLTSYSVATDALATVTRRALPQNTTVQIVRGENLHQLHPTFTVDLSISAISFSLDGQYLIIAGTPSTTPFSTELILVSMSDATLERFTLANPVDVVTLSATNNTIILGTDNGLLKTYSFPNIALQHSIAAHHAAITTISLSPNLSMVATGSTDTTARLWQLATLTPLSTALQHATAVIDVRFSKIDNTLITTEQNGFSLSWDSAQALTKHQLARGPGPSALHVVNTTAHHPAGLLFAIGTNHGDVRIFNAPGSNFISPLSFGSRITALTFSDDGRLLVIGTASGHLSIYDFTRREMIYENVSHLDSISFADLSSNNQYVTVVTTGGQVVLWDLAQNNLAPTQLAMGSNPSFLCLNAPQTAVLFTTNDSTLHEVTSETNFSQLGTKLDFELPIDQVVLSRHTDDGLVITQRIAHPITTSMLNTNGSRIEFAGEIQDVAIAADGHYALSSLDRTIAVGKFNDNNRQIRITAHRLAARFVRFTENSSILLAIGSPSDAVGTSVLQTVSISDNTVLKRTLVPFDIVSVATTLLPDSNDLLVTTNRGDVWRIDVTSLTFRSFEPLPLAAREIVSQGQMDLLLARDDTIIGLPSKQTESIYLSNFQTIHLSYSEELNWVLRANNSQFAIQSAQTGQQICPPITTPTAIREAILVSNSRRPLVLIATDDGIYQYTVDTPGSDVTSLTVDINLLSGTRVNTENQIVQLTHKDVANILSNTNIPPPQSANTLNWLRRYSTSISAQQWSAHIDHLRSELSKLSPISNTDAKRTLVADLNYALVSSGNYPESINLLLSLSDDVVKSTYQAVVLAAWIEDSSLYNRSLRQLLKRADPRIPQHFVYLLNGLSLARHNFPIESLQKSLDRLPTRLASNPLVLRGQLAYAIFRDDKLQVSNILAKLPKSGLRLPIQIYAKMADVWTAPQLITDDIIGQFQQQIGVLPALESGNPGRSWDERCLLDILLRRLKVDATLYGGDDD